jgi:hypothetical protein
LKVEGPNSCELLRALGGMEEGRGNFIRERALKQEKNFIHPLYIVSVLKIIGFQ